MNMKPSSSLPSAFRFLFSMILLVILSYTAPANAANELNYMANAYGTYAFVGNTVKAGKSSFIVMGCGAQPPAHHENTAASVDIAALQLNTGNIYTTADAMNISNGTTSQATAQVNNINLLSGLIQADTAQAVSKTSRVSSGFKTSASNSEITNLEISGVPILVKPSPNTKITLPGFGYIVLNEQISSVSSKSASLTVNMLHVVINQSNTLGIAAGTEIIVGHATSGLKGFFTGFLGGNAYGSTVKVGAIVKSGRTALQPMPCLGTKGKIRENSLASVNVPGILVTGAVVDSVKGVANAKTASGQASSSVESTRIAAGLIKAGLTKANVQASTDGSSIQLKDVNSGFKNLSVAGFPKIDANVAPNTKVKLAGLGTLWLHRVIKTPKSIEVRMIELLVTSNNTAGLPVGTKIQVGVAKAAIR